MFRTSFTRRVLGAGIVTGVFLALTPIAAAPALAAEPITAAILPATGNTQSAIDVLTIGPCPSSEWFTVRLIGKGLDPEGANIVGVAQTTSLIPQENGALRIPFSMTLAGFAALRGVPKLEGRYDVAVRCRTKPSDKALFTYYGAITVDAAGKYTSSALTAGVKPPVPTPIASDPAGGGATGAPAASGQPEVSTSSAPNPAETGSAVDPGTANPQATDGGGNAATTQPGATPGSTAGAATGAATPGSSANAALPQETELPKDVAPSATQVKSSGGGLNLWLVGGGLALLAFGLVPLFRGTRRRAAAEASSDEPDQLDSELSITTPDDGGSSIDAASTSTDPSKLA